MSTQTLPIAAKAREYKEDINSLETSVKAWKEACLEKISVASNNCYEAFNDLQMELTKILDKSIHDKYQLLCYKETYGFLEFVENEVNPDFCVFLLNNSRSFAALITHYNKYCTKIEKQYSIELKSEKAWRNHIKAIDSIKSYLKHE